MTLFGLGGLLVPSALLAKGQMGQTVKYFDMGNRQPPPKPPFKDSIAPQSSRHRGASDAADVDDPLAATAPPAPEGDAQQLEMIWHLNVVSELCWEGGGGIERCPWFRPALKGAGPAPKPP